MNHTNNLMTGDAACTQIITDRQAWLGAEFGSAFLGDVWAPMEAAGDHEVEDEEEVVVEGFVV